MNKFFSATLLAALLWAPPALAEPRLTPERLETEIGVRVERVPEFEFIRKEAEKLGVKVYLFGGTAAAYSHYVREDLLREAGDARFPEHRFDYDYTNIFRSTQDLDVVIDGTAEQAEELERALVGEYPHFIGDKGASWEVRPLRVSRGAKEAILGNPNFLNQHTDSHSTGLVEITKPKPGTGAVRDVRDWESRKPQFLRDVTEAKLHYYFNPLHDTTTRAIEGLNPPILSVIRYLTKAFQYSLEIRPEDLPLIRKIISEFKPADLKNDYLQKWVEKNGKKLFQHAVDLEYAWNTLEELGLRRKLAAIRNDPDTVESLAWWMNKEPLRTKPIGQGDGITAAELAKKHKLPKLVVAHETNSYLAYESITRQRGGELNALISRDEKAGEAAAFGDGFYTQVGRKGARGTGLTIRMEIDPRARLGSDFTMNEGNTYLVLTNKAAAKVIQEQINISMPEYFLMLAEGKSFSSDDKALLEQFHRRVAKQAKISPEDEKSILAIVETESKKHKPRLAVLSEWFRLPVATKYPEIAEEVIERRDKEILQLVVREAFPRPEWANFPHLVQRAISLGDNNLHAALFTHVFSQPHWARHPELVAQFFGPSATNFKPAPTWNGRIAEGLEPSGWFAKNLLPEPAWAAYPEIVRAAMEATKDPHILTLFANEMASPQWAQHPELLKSLIDSDVPAVHLALTQIAFAKEHWAKHPELLERLIETADQGTLKSVAGLFEQPFWSENTALQKKLYEKGDRAVRVALADALGPNSKVADFRSVILDAIRKGPATLRADAATVLAEEKWWPEKELMNALLEKKDIKAISTLAGRISVDYFNEAPEVLEYFLRSGSRQIQDSAVRNIVFRSDKPLRDTRSIEWLLANAHHSIVNLMDSWIIEREPEERAKYVKILLDRNDLHIDDRIADEILRRANTTDQAETIRTLIRRGDPDNISMLVREVLSDKKWTKHPDLISEVIQASSPSALAKLAWYIFSEERWGKNRNDLMAQMLEKGEGPVANEMMRHIHELPWEQQKALFEKILERGTQRGKENVARILLTYSDLDKRIEFAKPLLKGGDLKVQKLLRSSFVPSWKKMQAIDQEFLELLSAKNPMPPTCAAAFANITP